MLTAGSLADRLGRRRVFLVGVVVFTAISVACALATDITGLDVARAVQGLSAALMFASALPFIADAYPQAADRGGAFAVYGATIAASGDTPDVHASVGTEVPYSVRRGPVTLAWFVGPDCRTQDSAPVDISLAARSAGYAFAYFADPTHLRLLYVPVQASGAGNAGVVNSGDGPAFDEGTETYRPLNR